MKDKNSVCKYLLSFSIGCFAEYIIRFSWWNLYESTLINCIKSQNVEINFSFAFSAIIIAAVFSFWMEHRDRFNIFLSAVSALFGMIQIISSDIYYFKSFIDSQYISSIVQFNIIAFITYALLFYVLGECFFILLDSINLNTMKSIGKNNSNEEIASFVVFLAAWSPWLIAFFPGSVFYDMCVQLEQYLGNLPYKLHPYFSTLVMGKLFEFGKAIKNANFGIFLYILLQTLVCAFACSKVINVLKKMQCSRKMIIAAILFYAFWPMFGASVQLGEKDIICDGLFLLFTVWYINTVIDLRIHYDGNKTFLSKCIYLSSISILCALFRNECLATCTFCIGIIAILSYKYRSYKNFAVCILSCICMLSVYFVFDNSVVAKLDKAEQPGGWGTEEVLSIPIQQVGRTVKFRSGSISEIDKMLLDESFACGADRVADNYNPFLSDPLKRQYTGSKSFWKVWLSLLQKEPLVYAESIISSSFGYYSLIPKTFTTLDSAPTNNLPGLKYEFFINRDPDKEFNAVQISHIPEFEGMRDLLLSYADCIERIPVLRIAYKLGFYTWLVVLMIVYVCHKKEYYAMWGYIPALISIAVCIASPVNEYLRYYLKVVFMVPLLLGWTIFMTKEDKKGN